MTPSTLATRDAAALLATLAVWLLLCLAIQPFGNFPINDDWAYAYAVKSILSDGQFRLTGWSAPNLIAQAYWGALFCLPFGFSFDALRVSTLVLALAGIAAAYRLFRAFGAGPPTAAVGALTLGANPLYLQFSPSFMTDVPFTAMSTISLLLYVRGVDRERATLVALAFLTALVALFIRQFALALPLAFGAALIARRGWRTSTVIAALAPVLLFAGLHLLFQHWVVVTGRAPRFAEAVAGLSSGLTHVAWIRLSFFGVSIIPYFGLFTLPFLLYLLASRSPPWRDDEQKRLWLGATALTLALFALLQIMQRKLPVFGNSLSLYGLGPLTLRDTFLLELNLPAWPSARIFWNVMTACSVFAVAIIAVLGLRRLAGLFSARSTEPAEPVWRELMMLTFITAYTGAIMVASLLDNVFDRYLIVMIVPICCCLGCWLPTGDRVGYGRRVLGLAPLAACALFGVAAAHDYFAFNRARWEAIGQLLHEGVPPVQIDGGYEYGGLNLFNIDHRAARGKSWWWIRDDEYVVALGPMPGYSAVRTIGFPHWLWPPGYPIHVLRRIDY